MPVETTIQKNGLLELFSGTITINDISNAMQRIFSLPNFDELRYLVFDLTKVEHYELMQDRLEEVASSSIGASHSNANIRIAVVTYDSGLASMAEKCIQSGTVGYPTQIFSKIESAMIWARHRRPPIFSSSML
ncbi:hypothetical protein [Ferribacterium limneticum]|uniref:hypothetical protein n=1 Tax=Ferribacterium limneticum TaxID=76259 RepID=UPI001CF8851F|nr:hypothetical protein [Ferribacterium limneticum]UCV23619.1 STAS/SEC14 domain-containing protein [Ferribacterium limneticum]